MTVARYKTVMKLTKETKIRIFATEERLPYAPS